MKLLDFFKNESHAPQTKIVFMALVSGLANGYLLTIINGA